MTDLSHLTREQLEQALSVAYCQGEGYDARYDHDDAGHPLGDDWAVIEYGPEEKRTIDISCAVCLPKLGHIDSSEHIRKLTEWKSGDPSVGREGVRFVPATILFRAKPQDAEGI